MKTANRSLSYLSLCLMAAHTSMAAANTDDNIENVVVIGKHTGTPVANLAGSYEIIGRDQLDSLHVDDNVELFTKLPGVSVSRWNQGPTNADVSIRGFDGDGVVPHATLHIDGIPSTRNDGFGELDQLFSLNINSIEVFKGTSDVRFGLFNLAGNYQVFSRSDVDTTELEATIGSFNTKEIQGYSGHKTGKLTHNYAFGYRDTEGYRDNTELDRYSLSGKWFYDLSADTKVGYIARLSSFEADAPGYLSFEESRSNPKSSGSHASEDGGNKDNIHHSVHIESDFNELSVNARAYYQSIEIDRWVRFSEASSLSNRYFEQDQKGFLVNAEYQLNADWALLSGISYQSESMLNQRFKSIGHARVRGDNTRNQDYTQNTTGIYASIENQFNNQFEWNLGIRADKLDGDFVSFDKNGVGTPREILDFGWIIQPKLNLFYQVSQDLQLFFNFGESFQHLFGSSLYTADDVKALDVSRNTGWEIGSAFSIGENASLRLSTWRQDADDEFIRVDGETRNIGETLRKGWEAAFTWSPSEMFDVWANYSLVNTEIVNRGSSASTDTIGNELRSIPEYTSSVGLDAFITDKLTGRVHVDSQGDYFVNEENIGGKFGGYTMTSLSLDYQMEWGLLTLSANNIFDEYHEYVYDLTQDPKEQLALLKPLNTIHSPGDGRSFSLSVRFVL